MDVWAVDVFKFLELGNQVQLDVVFLCHHAPRPQAIEPADDATRIPAARKPPGPRQSVEVGRMDAQMAGSCDAKGPILPPFPMPAGVCEPLHYPQPDSNRCMQTENLLSWASRRWGRTI